ncbi:MAG: sulfurtransferase TusA family protein [Alphaproteobacteria bacterium]|nr:sulfurtransferase TusA family protein [Alphaproteobacteria bacterium]
MEATAQVLDTKGLNCPLPVLRAKKAIKTLAVGGTLTVYATDPGAQKDFVAFCQATGNELQSSTAENGVFTFVIRKIK